jgi:hypothetical protein
VSLDVLALEVTEIRDDIDDLDIEKGTGRSKLC